VISVPACTTWELQHLSPQWVVTQQQPDKIRVSSMPTGYRVVIKDPAVSNDSIVSGDGSLSFALTDIQSIEVRRSDAARTRFLILGITVGFVLTAVIACAATDCRAPDFIGQWLGIT